MISDKPRDSSPYNLPDDTVGALADNILNFILIGNVEGDLSGSSRGGSLLSHDVRVARLSFKSFSLSAIVSVQDPWEEKKQRAKAIHGNKTENEKTERLKTQGQTGERRTNWQFTIRASRVIALEINSSNT